MNWIPLLCYAIAIYVIGSTCFSLCLYGFASYGVWSVWQKLDPTFQNSITSYLYSMWYSVTAQAETEIKEFESKHLSSTKSIK